MWKPAGSANQDLGHRTGSVCTCDNIITPCQETDAADRGLSLRGAKQRLHLANVLRPWLLNPNGKMCVHEERQWCDLDLS